MPSFFSFWIKSFQIVFFWEKVTYDSRLSFLANISVQGIWTFQENPWHIRVCPNGLWSGWRTTRSTKRWFLLICDKMDIVIILVVGGWWRYPSGITRCSQTGDTTVIYTKKKKKKNPTWQKVKLQISNTNSIRKPW